MNTHTIVADLRHNMLETRKAGTAVSEPDSVRHETNSDSRLGSKQVSNLDLPWTRLLILSSSVSGESPPPPPRIFFGRDKLIEEVIGFAADLTPVALIGVGGIGKTSAVLTALHNDSVKQRFGEDRRFIRCDQFPASGPHLLRRLSKVIGAAIENPEDLSPLRPFLSSKEMAIVLDNAESILDPLGTSAQEIYSIVDELSQFSNIFLVITSRISTVPPNCEVLDIPTLSAEAAHDTFYRIYKRGERSSPINEILEHLDFHPLSITLLATVAQYNRWDMSRLANEWETRRTGVLHAQHSRSLATTIELSLASPMFQKLGPDARELLGVVAFFPQGVDEKNVKWLFPTVSDGTSMFDTFCILSLTYRSNGFVTMLAPLRDCLRPKDPISSPLLNTTKECYFSRLATRPHPSGPDFEEPLWIASEDVNVEHLLDVFTSINVDSENVWDACFGFLYQLRNRKPRPVMLGPKIEALPDNHPSKGKCLQELSWLHDSIGNLAERKRLLTRALQLQKQPGDDYQFAMILSDLSDTNRQLGLIREGIQQAREASKIFGKLGKTADRAETLTDLAWLLRCDNRIDAAEKVASRAIELLPPDGERLRMCRGYRVLGYIFEAKGETEKAIHHFEVALEIASSDNLTYQLFWVRFAMAEAFLREGRFDDAHAYIEQAKPQAINDTYLLARASLLHADVWRKQNMFADAKPEALRALDMFEKLGAEGDVAYARWILEQIDASISATLDDG